MSCWVISLRIFVLGNDIYTIEFYNHKNKDEKRYASFSFKDTNDAFEQIHQLISSDFDKGEASEIELGAGNGKIRLEFLKNFRSTYLRFAQYDKEETDIEAYSITLKKKQVQKLFGK